METIKSILASTTSHPSAEWVYTEARKVIPDISLGTVYRNLKILSGSGEIATVETTHSTLRYDANRNEHTHFVCIECGSVTDIFDDTYNSAELAEKGYKLESKKIVLYGLCPECNKNQNQKN